MLNGISDSIDDLIGSLVALQNRVKELEAENKNLSSQLSNCCCPKGVASQRKNTGGDETRNKKATETTPGSNSKKLTQRSLIQKPREFIAEDFQGKFEDDPSIAEYWLENIERGFQQLCYTPEQKLEWAVFLLKGEAYMWWTFTTQIKPVERLTWDFFSTEFRKKYINKLYLREKRREFMCLQQNDMSVAEYEREFVRLSRYAKELVNTEAEMCERFESGLNANIKIYLVGLQLREFSTLIERALMVEQPPYSGSGSDRSLSPPPAKRVRDYQSQSYLSPARTGGSNFKNPTQRSLIEKLWEFGVEDFRGKIEDDSSTAEYWLENIERVFQHLRYTPEQKLECAVFLLKEEAYMWWTFTTQIKPAERLNWDFFSTEFHKKYINELYLREKRSEFLCLQQNDMSVAEYEREFVRLSRYAKEMVNTEAEMCKSFERGLNANIKRYFVASQLREFSTLIETALMVEQPPCSGSGSDRSLSPPPAKRVRDSRSQSYSSPARTGGSGWKSNIPDCQHCGKRHAGECWKLTRGCFRCGSKDHFFRDCP